MLNVVYKVIGELFQCIKMSGNRDDYSSPAEWLSMIRQDGGWLQQREFLESSLDSGDINARREAAINWIGKGETLGFWEIYRHKVEPVVAEVWEISDLTLAKLKIQTIGMLSIEWIEQHAKSGHRDRPDLNYFAPMKIIQELLSEKWFDEVSADKKRFTVAWRNQLLEDLMASDCRDEFAMAWNDKNQRLQVKGHVMGALTKAGVFRENKYLPIARIYYGTHENSTDPKTLSNYMGKWKKTHYGKWIIDYVTKKAT